MLTRIRAALGNRPRSKGTLAALGERMARPPIGPRPQLTDDPVSRLVAKTQANLFSVERIASLQMLVPAVRALLPETAVPDISVAPALKHLGWPSDWSINFGPGRRTENLSVTMAIAGIAETGSVVLRSDPASPTTLNFLPDVHVIVLRTEDVVPYPEDVWARLRSKGGDWPRTVNIVAGPSRTADVGGIIVRPAHGPKSVHLILCES
ncbi:LUD domain-containing protein [Hyphomicrobium sp.]|uniref:LutC/YkgG family protein n=1 Tax=Hyphomicrobium sp. TaxID=82 RepID=UPI0025BAB409|nr:LUD domain-containing protein [Hyphomicrobium sp.]MCC7250800.1 LUD domain-containing protein [Hyphomicrobium sp.]